MELNDLITKDWERMNVFKGMPECKQALIGKGGFIWGETFYCDMDRFNRFSPIMRLEIKLHPLKA
jgi:hypothetical protein